MSVPQRVLKIHSQGRVWRCQEQHAGLYFVVQHQLLWLVCLPAPKLYTKARHWRRPSREAPGIGVKALFFDVFGTLVDWRTGVAREAEAHLKPLGYTIDWLAFADAWRARYGPAMEEVRSGRIPFARLDVLHRRMLESTLPQFNIKDLSEDVLGSLNFCVAPTRRLAGPDPWPGPVG